MLWQKINVTLNRKNCANANWISCSEPQTNVPHARTRKNKRKRMVKISVSFNKFAQKRAINQRLCQWQRMLGNGPWFASWIYIIQRFHCYFRSKIFRCFPRNYRMCNELQRIVMIWSQVMFRSWNAGRRKRAPRHNWRQIVCRVETFLRFNSRHTMQASIHCCFLMDPGIWARPLQGSSSKFNAM